jgi:hypothetical protein
LKILAGDVVILFGGQQNEDAMETVAAVSGLVASLAVMAVLLNTEYRRQDTEYRRSEPTLTYAIFNF